MPPSLVRELADIQRRLSALERSPRQGSVNEPLPVGNSSSRDLEGTAGVLGYVNSTGMNMEVVHVAFPFFIPESGGKLADVSAEFWLESALGGRTDSLAVSTSKVGDYYTHLASFCWIHSDPIGFDDSWIWKTIRVHYKATKRDKESGLCVFAGPPSYAVGFPLGTYAEESISGHPQVDGSLTLIRNNPIYQ